MNATANRVDREASQRTLAHVLPSQMRTAYATWNLGDHASDRRELDAATLEQAVALATPPMMPARLAKGGFPAFVILETNDAAAEGRARQRVHFYTVKVKREWCRVDSLGNTTTLTANPYAVPSGSLAMDAFEPRRRFRAGEDDPVSGRQAGEGRLVEANRL